MKKNWRILLIIIAIIGALVILIYPLAPLWQKLGLDMKCITGNFPDLKFVSCSKPAVESIESMPIPTPGIGGPIPLIVDDDGSPDGMVALMYLLKNPRYDVQAVTISYGEAHPQQFAPLAAQILAAFDRTDIPVGYGNDVPLTGENAFPESWRQASDDFWNLDLPERNQFIEPVPAAELIVETIIHSEQPVTIFISGSHTNLAEALRLHPAISANIKEVFIMGGSVFQPGNIHSDFPDNPNEVAEWNIWVDPQAASEVFDTGLTLHLIPLDATKQIVWTRDDLREWRRNSDESQLAYTLVSWMLDSWSPNGVYVWDLVAAVQATLPEVCPEKKMGLEIVTQPGPEQGRTAIDDRPSNVAVCFDPNLAKVKGLVTSVFQMTQ